MLRAQRCRASVVGDGSFVASSASVSCPSASGAAGGPALHHAELVPREQDLRVFLTARLPACRRQIGEQSGQVRHRRPEHRPLPHYNHNDAGA